MKKKNLFLAVLAIVLVLGSSIGTAIAYFTSFVEAKGAYVIRLVNPPTKITEEYDGQKRVTISNTANEGLEPIFVRVKVLNGTDLAVTVNPPESGKWITKETPSGEWDGYYYYTEAISGGQSTDVLSIKVNAGEDSNIKEGDTVDVIVVYEAVPAAFNADESPNIDAAWENAENITVLR